MLVISALPLLIELTNEPILNALLGRFRWADSTISYSFPELNSLWSTHNVKGYGVRIEDGEPWTTSFSSISRENRNHFSEILSGWENVANLKFNVSADDVNTVGIIRIANTFLENKPNDLAWTYYPSVAEKAGDIWINAQAAAGQQLWVTGSYANFAVLHETGHALGLKHPFDDDITLPTVLDNQSLTVMSYYAKAGVVGSKFSFFPTTPMVLDIAAIQAAYGANTAFNPGDTVFRFSDSMTYHQTIWDGGGNDTLNYDGIQNAVINLQSAHGSRIGNPVFIEASQLAAREGVDNVWIALNTMIENLVSGSGNDFLMGNEADNLMDGGAGLDTFATSGIRERYSLQAKGDVWEIFDSEGTDGTDSLINIERLNFSNMNLALDVSTTGAAGRAAQIIGTVAYPLIKASAVAGEIISLIDSGKSTAEIFQDALNNRAIENLAGSSSNIDLARLVGRNVLGTEIDDEFAHALASNMIGSGGTLSQADFLVAVSIHPLNQTHIEFLGLASTGLEYM